MPQYDHMKLAMSSEDFVNITTMILYDHFDEINLM